jgi:hypothetical protein
MAGVRPYRTAGPAEKDAELDGVMTSRGTCHDT